MAFDTQEVTVTYGEEKYFPIRYQGFTLGPFTYKTAVLIGETVPDAVRRANKVVHDLADELFKAKRDAFLARLETLKTPPVSDSKAFYDKLRDKEKISKAAKNIDWDEEDDDE